MVVEGERALARDTRTIQVESTRVALSGLAVTFYGEPFKGMSLTGITGTNGKTTTAYLLESVLLASGAKPGVIGTINYRFSGNWLRADVTTPESLDLMRVLREMADAQVTHVVMEVSSHALDQGRVRDCPFRVAVFTNISRDHLDYHGSMEAYWEAKSRLFRGLGNRRAEEDARAVINGDDPQGRTLIGVTDAEVVTYGLGEDCHVRAEALEATREGLRARLVTPAGEREVRSPLLGAFNIYNILAAAAAALSLDTALDRIAEGIERLEKIPGRLEPVDNERDLAIRVDYAHTPDALMKVLESLRPLIRGRLITVFGCGGDRDKGKRREMGRVAARYSHLLLITSDNPRTEDPKAIISQIEQGVIEEGLEPLPGFNRPGTDTRGYQVEPDRTRAIRRAVRLATGDDLVLIAGKGHEDYQIVGRERRPFDDRKAAEAAVRGI